MAKKDKDADGGKLSIQFDETTLKPIGANHNVWTRDLSLYGNFYHSRLSHTIGSKMIVRSQFGRHGCENQ